MRTKKKTLRQLVNWPEAKRKDADRLIYDVMYRAVLAQLPTGQSPQHYVCACEQIHKRGVSREART